MIYSNINDKRNSTIYHKVIIKALEALKQTDFSSGQKEYEINGKEMFIRVVQTVTKKYIEAFPEIHEKYVDLHYLIEGQERIYFSLEIPDKVVKHDVENDHVFFDRLRQKCFIDLHEGDFAVFFPEDVHMAATAVNEPSKIKKAIVKIAVGQF